MNPAEKNSRFKVKILQTLATVAALSLFGLGACAPYQEKTGEGTSSQEKPLVLTTFTILQDMAQNVAGDHLRVVSITNPGEEIHDYTPSPEDIKKAEKAKLILNNGFGLERWFKKLVANSNAKTVKLSKGVKPISIVGGEYDGNPNPHAWMSPSDGEIYVKNIRDAFIALDPKHKADYESNAAKYSAKIRAVGQEMENKLAHLPQKSRVLVTCEGAFSYLARDAKMAEKYLWPVNSEGALTPKGVAEVENYVKENKVPAVFCESTVGNKMGPIVEATGAKFGGTLYVDSLSDKNGPVPTYLDLLKFDAKTITTAMTEGK